MTTKHFQKLMEEIREGVPARKPHTSLCGHCKEQKTSDCFYPSIKSWCKECMKESAAKRKALDPDYKNRMERARRAKNPGCTYTETKKEYAKNNVEKQRAWVAAATSKFKAEHPDEYAAKISEKARRREVAKQQRVPSWSSPSACRLVYLQRVKTQKLTGIRHAVDHSVPLRGKLVSGLHVPENLVVIPFEVNAQKSNKFDPMTYEWWPECCPKPPHKETIAL